MPVFALIALKTAAMTAVYRNEAPIVTVGRDWIDRLKGSALAAALRRSRLCLHRDNDEKVHEMMIAFCGDSPVRPHRHFGKSESFHVVEGRLRIVLFDEKGAVAERIELGEANSGLPFVCRINSPAWHAVLPMTEFVIVCETTAGPFVDNDGNFASWAPEDGPDLAAWLADLRSKTD